MIQPPVRDKETRELIERFKARRKRRRTLGIVYASVGGAVFLGLVIVAVFLLTRAPDGEATMSSADSTSESMAALAASGETLAPGQSDASTTSSPSTTTVPSSTTTGAAAALPPTTLPPTTLPPTTLPPTTSTSHSTTTTTKATSGLVVCIDPGHQARGDSSLEPVGPGSSTMKAKVSDGTAGVATGTPESELVLAVSLKLRDALVSRGIKVVMTRTTQDVRLSNIERAQIANEARADLFVRIHADGSENRSVAGIHVLYPASTKGWTDDIAAASKTAASLAQHELIAATGANDRGIDARSDIAGFNWADVPVILPEIGFMSNAAEDKLLATAAYQDKIVAGLTRAILAFLGAG